MITRRALLASAAAVAVASCARATERREVWPETTRDAPVKPPPSVLPKGTLDVRLVLCRNGHFQCVPQDQSLLLYVNSPCPTCGGDVFVHHACPVSTKWEAVRGS